MENMCSIRANNPQKLILSTDSVALAICIEDVLGHVYFFLGAYIAYFEKILRYYCCPTLVHVYVIELSYSDMYICTYE